MFIQRFVYNNNDIFEHFFFLPYAIPTTFPLTSYLRLNDFRLHALHLGPSLGGGAIRSQITSLALIRFGSSIKKKWFQKLYYFHSVTNFVV